MFGLRKLEGAEQEEARINGAWNTTLQSTSIPGSILASPADATFTNGVLDGTVVVRSAALNLQLNWHPYQVSSSTGRLLLAGTWSCSSDTAVAISDTGQTYAPAIKAEAGFLDIPLDNYTAEGQSRFCDSGSHSGDDGWLMRHSSLVLRALLLLALAAALLRLAILGLGFARYNLQVDFSAYYTAGEAALAGLSPYVNQAGQEPAIWDGLCFTTFSRFLYPPPALLPFLGLALLPFAAAKLLWTALLLVLAAAALLLGARLAGIPWRSRSLTLVGLGLAVSWPLLLTLERGQIDLLTLTVLLCALWAGRGRTRGNAVLAGILWAVAIIFKPHSLLALPFLLLRRQWLIAAGAGAALALAFGLSGLLAPAVTHEYRTTVAPRLARHGDDPPKSDLLPRETMRAVLAGLPPQIASKQEHLYRRFGLEFDERGSLVWAVGGEAPARPGTLSLILWAALSGLVLACRRPRKDEPTRVGCRRALLAANDRGRAWRGRAKRARGGGRCGAEGRSEPFEGSHVSQYSVEDLAWWQVGLCVVLLSAPLTWAMNLVWLVPAGFVIAARQARWNQQAPGWLATTSQVMGVVGLALAAVPDRFAWPWPAPLVGLSPYKYVLGAALCALAMVAGSWVDRGLPEVD